MSAIIPPKRVVHYSDDDGLPTSDNTAQFRWIVTVQGNLEVQFRDAPDVFVAGNHLIYPIEDAPDTKQAPDVYVVFGRPEGDRGSYKVWEEDGIFPQVVFEIWSPGNRYDATQKKFAFYEKYGAEEYYILYPEFPAHVEVWRRDGGKLVQVVDFANWVSPRLGTRFGIIKGELAVRGPSGRLFLSPSEMAAERDAAEKRAEEEKRRAEEEKRRAEKLAAKLRELGIDPDAV
jgi:Uma2 family endonuclease